MNTRKRAKDRLFEVRDRARFFFSAVPGSMKGHLNGKELIRITVAAFSAAACVFGSLEAILIGVGTLFPAPLDAALAGFVIATVHEVFRRLEHGEAVAIDRVANRRPR